MMVTVSFEEFWMSLFCLFKSRKSQLFKVVFLNGLCLFMTFNPFQLLVVSFNIVVSLPKMCLFFRVRFMLVKFTMQFGLAHNWVCLDPMVSPLGLVRVTRLPLLFLLLHLFVSHFVSICPEQLLLQSFLERTLASLRIGRR